ncbi:uncharacterized protein J4E78_008596 [Alternaria triticimaculans]|uniref:uncharacterized protein n=1 Tax=Alternaria triticimaculans TaxID=297637 RepID=UPI0020C36658|nr:uncharacterized protein J4E78_008596 [Alternaria triticimaculans]KAI4649078.1 hypothetical protein J4E78_008596 [Alternaria triticimaculans]
MDSMVQWARILGAVIITWNIADVIAALAICRPLAKNWNFNLPGTCGSQPNFYFAMGVINLITDAVMILLPMPYLYKLRLAWRRKLAAMALLSIGVGTWAITIYRQTLLPGLDFMDMTYTGVLATILSGLEPAVAIVLACIPLMRPLFSKSNNATRSSFDYDSSKKTSLFSKKGNRRHKDPTATFSELVDDNDASSQIEMQPVKTCQVVRVSSVYKHDREQRVADSKHAITVERRWEVRRD